MLIHSFELFPRNKVREVDWSNLYDDLLRRVAFVLFVSDDYMSLIAIGGVCTSWRAVWIGIREIIMQFPPSHHLVWVKLSKQLRENYPESETGIRTVWLMLSEGVEYEDNGDNEDEESEDGEDEDGGRKDVKDEDENEDSEGEEDEDDGQVLWDEEIRGFCEFADTEENVTIHYMRVPTKEKLCFSFPEGWVLTLGVDFAMNLFHLLSGDQIKLPNWNTTFQDDEDYIFPFFAARAVLTANPSKTLDFKVITTCGKWVTAVAGPGDTYWSAITVGNGEGFLDFTVYKGLVYAINRHDEIWVFDVSGAEPDGKFLFNFNTDSRIVYLVESSGDLLAVTRILISVEPFKTAGFCVFRLDVTNGTRRRVKSLGNRSLFLGYNASFSVDASKVRGCKANCIYFTDDNENSWDIDMLNNPGVAPPEYWCENGIGGGLDMGIYDLTDGTIKPHILTSRYYCIRGPMWVVPNFH